MKGADSTPSQLITFEPRDRASAFVNTAPFAYTGFARLIALVNKIVPRSWLSSGDLEHMEYSITIAKMYTWETVLNLM